MTRRPAVAGSFYPADPEELRRTLGRCFNSIPREPRPGLAGAVVPHAGYLYSGAVAARAYARVPEAETYVIVGPNHRGRGSGVAVSTEPWRTPLGVAEPDLDFIEALTSGAGGEGSRRSREALSGNIIDTDEEAHRLEHSLEVQVPFLQFLFSRVRIVAVAMALQDPETSREVAAELRAALDATRRRVVVLASSDFTHYEPEEVARARDTPVLDAVVRRDAAGFYRRLDQTGASLCGHGAIGVLLGLLGPGTRKAELLRYATSGDVTGDREEVVAYAAVTLEAE